MTGWKKPAACVGAAAIALLLSTPAGFAWGPEGHRTVALIADELLQKGDPGANAKLRALLASDKDSKLTRNDIASEATWADMLREKSPEARTATTAWHYVRLKADNTDLAAACFGHKPLPAGYPASHGPADNCSVDKIKQFQAELQNPNTSEHEKLTAVQFLLNLVGDLNDPLDTIDRDAACTAVQVGPHPPVRLSTYWEATLVREVVGADPAKGAARIDAALPQAEAQKWAEGDPEAWARDSYEVAKTVVFGFGDAQPAAGVALPLGKGEKEACRSVTLYRVGLDYETKALAAVKAQLAKGGVRLARVLRDGLK